MCDKQGRDTQQLETSLPLFLLAADLEEGGLDLMLQLRAVMPSNPAELSLLRLCRETEACQASMEGHKIFCLVLSLGAKPPASEQG